MRQIITKLSAALMISGAAVLSAGAETFPTYTSKDLNFREVTIPAEFPGETTIVFIAYKQRQQPAINAWVTALGLDPEIGAEFVELPVVGEATKLIRSTVDNGMRSGIVNTALRARTITLYENASNVNDALGFSGRNEIRVLLVKRDGEILWKTSGAVTAEKAKELATLYDAQ